jgi:excisionase family DNA binding protein
MPIPKPHAGQRPFERLVAIAEIAELLGVEVRHVRRLVHERRIPFIKWGHLLRFDPAEIRAWIDENRRLPAESRVPR